MQSGAPSVPPAPGTYVLVLECTQEGRARIGALGTLALRPGFYAYAGSARGPGGLAARIARHARRARHPHWHVDYLRRRTRLVEVWFAASGDVLEHRFAAALASAPDAVVAMDRFGASDCRCPAHLFRFAGRPDAAAFADRLASSAGPRVAVSVTGAHRARRGTA